MDSEKYLHKKIDECIQLSRSHSTTVHAEIHLDSHKLGYTIIPRHESDYHNVHIFSGLSGDESSSYEKYYNKIEQITNEMSLQIVNHDKEEGKITVAKESDQMPTANEMMNSMKKFLTAVFSVSIKEADIIIKIS